MTATAAGSLENPFPGLRPFREDEEHLFFGRENQVDRMVDKLATTRFLAVVGTSGTGKSSLVNCGLKPALHRGLMASAGTSWRMVQFRPGGSPIHSMAQAFAREDGLLASLPSGGFSLTQIAESTLRMSSLGLADLCRFAQLPPGTNLLVVVDQFEELFRYSKAVGGIGNPDDVSGDAIAFVNLLLEPLSHREYPIYIVLTMRSDFLGECSKFDGLPEVINESQYLVPRLTRDERREAIAGPIGVASGEMGPVLLTRLVNDVGDNPDQLSIMQHAVNRTWAHWQKERHGEGALSLEDYEAVGTMARALDEHAEEAFGELQGGRQQKLCEKVFKAITDRGTDARGIRRPMPFRSLCEVVGASAEELTPVLEVFRVPDRSFLMPPAGEVLEPDTVIDISHEILMRVWERLKKWTAEEAQSAGTYRRLAESAELFAAGNEALLRNPALRAALDWQYSETPNPAWAQLYRSGFENAITFLETSKQAWDLERAEGEFQRRWRRYAPYLGVLVFIVFLTISPKISSSLRPMLRPRLERILLGHASKTPTTIHQANMPPVVAKTLAKEHSLSESNPAPDFIPEQFRRGELAETIVNTVGYGIGGVLSGLLYALLWLAGRRAYRRLAFPGILIKAGARPPTAESEKPRDISSEGRSRSKAASEGSTTAELVLPTVWRRFMGALLDFLAFMTLGVFAIAGVIATEDMIHVANGSHAENIFIFGLWLVFDYLYQALTRIRPGSGTLGDLACGILLVDRKGRHPGFGRGSARYIVRGLPWIVSYVLIAGVQSSDSSADTQSTVLGGAIIFSFLISSLVLITIPFTRRRQAIYDMVVGIVAVRRIKLAKPHRDRFDSVEAA